MAETLGRKLVREREEGNLCGIMIARGVKAVNNAQFVDDIFLLREPQLLMPTY